MQVVPDVLFELVEEELLVLAGSPSAWLVVADAAVALELVCLDSDADWDGFPNCAVGGGGMALPVTITAVAGVADALVAVVVLADVPF